MASWEPWAAAVLRGGVRGIPLRAAVIDTILGSLGAEAEVVSKAANASLMRKLKLVIPRDAVTKPAEAELEQLALAAWGVIPEARQKAFRRTARLLSLEDDITERRDLARDLAGNLSLELLAHDGLSARLKQLTKRPRPAPAPSNVPPEDLVGGRFELVELLGEGGYGSAHKARDRDGSFVVVKLLHRKLAKSKKQMERFRREIRALAKLGDHPHVVSLVADGICSQRKQPYYAMRWSDGKPLGNVLKEAGGKLPLDRALRLVEQLLDALTTCHAAGILHRDLKPDNMLIEQPGSPQEKVIILDFGLAKHATGSQQTIANLTGKSLIGTPLYMSPEQCTGMKVSGATDIYSAGCVLFECLAGRPPFKANSSMAVISLHVMEAPPLLTEYFPAAPRALVELIAASLDKEPANRPSAAEMKAMLEEIRGDPEGLGLTCPVPAVSAAGIGASPSMAPTVPPESPHSLSEAHTPVPTPSSHTPAPTPPPVAPIRTAAVAPPRPELREGGILGGYTLEKFLGQGGFGAVFLTHLTDGRPAALKALLPIEGEDPMQVEKRFDREIRLLKNLRYTGIPEIYDSGVDRGVEYVLIEFIDGEDLNGVITRGGGSMPIEGLLPILRQVLPALDFIHGQGVVHCDLKPENIRIRNDGRAYLLDLGIAKMREGSALGGRSIVTMDGGVIGTFQYLPPEFVRGRRQVTPAADVYSMGVLIYQALAGRLPFNSDDPRQLMKLHATAAPPSLTQAAPHVPPRVAQVVMRCLDKVPNQRYMTAGLLLQALEEAIRPPAPTPPPAQPPLARTSHAPPPQPEAPAYRPQPEAPAYPPTMDVVASAGMSGPTIPPPTGRLGKTPSGYDNRQDLETPATYRLGGREEIHQPDSLFPATIVGPAAGAQPVPPTNLDLRGEAAKPVLAFGVLNGSRAGEVLDLDPARVQLLIGRDPNAAVAFAPDEPGVSRRHAEIRWTGGEPWIHDLNSSGGTFVEGTRVSATGLPLAHGVTVRLGDPGIYGIVDYPDQLRDAQAPDLALKRLDRDAPPCPLDGPKVIGRSAEAAVGLDPARDAAASALHCRVAPCFGKLMVEDLNSSNGTFVNGKRVHVSLLQDGDELNLGGAQGPRFRIIPAAPFTAAPREAPGRSKVPLPDSGDALRAKLDVEVEGQLGRLFLFAGTRLRFGRNRAKSGQRQNDLLLRGFPRGNEARSLVRQRTNSVSGHHGTFVITQNGVAIRDDGSSQGTQLDGKQIDAHELAPLEDEFLIEVAHSIGIRGRVFPADSPGPAGVPGVDATHPVGCVRLERTRDGEHHSYVLLLREVSLGSGHEDALCLPHPSVKPHHARLGVRDRRFFLTAPRSDADVSVSGAPVPPGKHVPLGPGAEIQLGEVRLRFSLATDDDMIPPKR